MRQKTELYLIATEQDTTMQNLLQKSDAIWTTVEIISSTAINTKTSQLQGQPIKSQQMIKGKMFLEMPTQSTPPLLFTSFGNSFYEIKVKANQEQVNKSGNKVAAFQ